MLLNKALPMYMCSLEICDQSSDDRCSPLAFGVVNVGLTDQITLISYVINQARQLDLLEYLHSHNFPLVGDL